MVIIVPNFNQRVDVTLRSRASPLSQRKSRCIIGCFDRSEARQTQDTSVYEAQIYHVSSDTWSKIGLTLVQDIREIVLRHLRTAFGCNPPLENRHFLTTRSTATPSRLGIVNEILVPNATFRNELVK